MKALTIVCIITLLTATTIAKTIAINLNSQSGKDSVANGPVSMELGDRLRIVVDENPTTGYKWIIKPLGTNSIF